jgi:hypothetical protein
MGDGRKTPETPETPLGGSPIWPAPGKASRDTAGVLGDTPANTPPAAGCFPEGGVCLPTTTDVVLGNAPAPTRAAERTESVRARGSMGGDVRLELPLDRVVQQFIEQQTEEWKRAHLVCRYDRHHGYIVGFTAPALDTLVQYMATQDVFGSEAERNHYASDLRWRVNHGVAQVPFKPFQATNVPDVLPGQLRLFD